MKPTPWIWSWSLCHPAIIGGILPLTRATVYEAGNGKQYDRQSQLSIAADDNRERNAPLPRPSTENKVSQGVSTSQHSVFDPLEDLQDALAVMQSTWFTVTVGTWPTGIDWTRAVLDTYLVSALSSLSKALDRPGRLSRASGTDQAAAGKAIENDINQYFAQNVCHALIFSTSVITSPFSVGKAPSAQNP